MAFVIAKSFPSMGLFKKYAFFRITQGSADRNAQKATLPEKANIDFSVYNLANFTKHVFFKINEFFRKT